MAELWLPTRGLALVQATNLTVTGVDLRAFQSDPVLREWVWDARDLRGRAWDLASKPTRRQALGAQHDAAQALARLEVRDGLRADNPWLREGAPADPTQDTALLAAYLRTVAGFW